MGSVGDAYDNAMAESFFLHARGRTAQPSPFRLPGRGEDGVLQLHRSWYDPARLHSALGYRSPMTYETDEKPALIAA